MSYRRSKRPAVECIDLTGSDNETYKQPQRKHQKTAGPLPTPPSSGQFSSSNQPPKVPASTSAHPSASPYSSSSHHERDSWAALSTQDQADADAEVGGDDFDDDRYQRYELYGTLSTKVVGVRYYDGRATIGEHVLVKREPGNPYDRNALRIDNVMNQQIGHIGRTVAAKLAPLMDSGAILVEGQLTGEKGAFDMPIGLRLFSSGDPVEQAAMRELFRGLRLPLDHLIRQEKERVKAEKERRAVAKEAEERRKQRVKEVLLQEAARKANDAKRDSGIGMESSQGFTNLAFSSQRATPSMDNLMYHSTNFGPRELGEVVDKYGSSEEQLAQLPFAKQPPEMETKLLPYQRQGLAWLLDRESPVLPQQDSKDTVQLWKRSQTGGYTNIATNYTQNTPRLASGGILADDMGLGKTIQLTSLLVADPRRSRSTPTLIVCPLSVMSNWSGQIETHVKKDYALKVLIYHGNNRKISTPQELRSFDVVITTYETMALEYMPGSGKSAPQAIPRMSGLYSITWRRIVLDEGHSIRNAKAKKSLAAFALATLAQSKWVLTGTPIVNNLKDLQSHCRFIGLAGGLEQAEVFSSCVIRPLNQGIPTASILLQALIGTICLRRMKNMKFVDLRLPELSQQMYTVPWRPEEREKYDALGTEARGLLEGLQTRGLAHQPSNNAFSHLLEVLLRCRQVCNHWTLCRDRVTNLMDILEQNKQVTLTPQNKKALQDLLQLNIDSQEDCPICLETLHEPRITTCGHAFGFECIERVIETQHRCPMCRSELKDSTALVEPAAAMGESTQFTTPASDDSSSKIDALLDILRATSARDATTKTVIFSQWTSFLNIIEPHLRRAGIQYTRLDGTMSASARDDAISAINTHPTCSVLLASLSVCSVGLNLTAANQVILADSWWSAAIEDQAVDRVYRLGQRRKVSVWRLVMEESIEERVLEVQKEKRRLVSTAFGGRTGERGKERVARLADIQRLLA